MSPFLLFLSAFALGAALRVLYLLAALLAKSTRLKPVRYIFDIIWCAAAFTAFSALTLFLHDGKFETYMLLGALGGLAACSLILRIFKKDKAEPLN